MVFFILLRRKYTIYPMNNTQYENTSIHAYNSPIGILTLSSNGQYLTGLHFYGQKHFGNNSLQNAITDNDLPLFKTASEWLNRYFEGCHPNPFELPLLPSGSPFQLRVWEALLGIPYGETVSYGDLAQLLCTSPRAIGNAVGRNPIGIIIPCHRVVGANGQLTGFAGGIERKIWLLEHEKRGRSPF